MPEVFPLKASWEYAGSYCLDKKCTNYARFLVVPLTDKPERYGVCGHHLSTYMKGTHTLDGVAAVVQEIPGNWGRDLIGIPAEGLIGRMPAANRKALSER